MVELTKDEIRFELAKRKLCIDVSVNAYLATLTIRSGRVPDMPTREAGREWQMACGIDPSRSGAMSDSEALTILRKTAEKLIAFCDEMAKR